MYEDVVHFHYIHSYEENPRMQNSYNINAVVFMYRITCK